MSERDRIARILIVPCDIRQPVESERCIQFETTVVNKHADKRCRDTLRRRPGAGARHPIDTVGITLVNDLPLVHDDQA
jgi:hypothetical protein